jgi:S1-C subfamily serine protease
MPHARALLALAFVLALAWPVRADERDPRDQYGTPSLEAARKLDRALELSEAKKHKEALAAIEEAIKADDKCQLAYFAKSVILGDLGEIPASIEALKKCLSDDVRRTPHQSAQAAVNLGLILGKLGEYDESNLWFTRAILEDHANAAGQRGKAYRNLGINLNAQGKRLAAALSVVLAFRDKAPNTDQKMVRAFLDQAEGQEVARLLYFNDAPPRPAKRAQEAKLSPVELGGAVAEKVTDLLPDPQGRHLIALVPGAAHYYVITTDDKPAARKVAVKAPLLCACLAEGHLYAVADDPLRIDKLDVESGKVEASYSLNAKAPSSLAVYPTQGVAFFPVDRVVHGISLKTGAVFKTDIPGQVVAGHPGQRFLYSFLKPENRDSGPGYILIDGRPVFFRTRTLDWQQTTLFKSVVVPSGLLVAEVRENAASNAWRMSVSPDGSWVAVAGGGGWRPAVPQGAAGYGIAVFGAHNLEQLQGFFATDAYPQGVCFNPVTQQVAAIRGQDAKVYHLADPKAATPVNGPFSGVGAWSGNGRYLVLARENAGLAVFENALDDSERARAGTWWKAIQVVPVRAAPARAAAFQPVEALRDFALKAPPREELAAALAKAADQGRTDRPGRWQDYAPYVKGDELQQAQEAAKYLEQKEDLGIGIFRLRKALKANPDSVPIKFFLAELLRQGNQGEEAEKLYLAVVQADQGRTELSCVALNRLAALLADRDQGPGALHCLAASLLLDRANPDTLALAVVLLKKHHFSAEAERFAKLSEGLPGAAATGLPTLAKPPADRKKHTPAELFKKAVWSVVFIETPGGTGSGVCVGRSDIIVTNDHVVEGGSPIYVHPYIYKDTGPVRMPKVRATVVLRSPKEDLAVLKLEAAPNHLEPLPVAEASPAAGERVYAMGSPGLGKQVLEQSISEGLISSNSRKIEGNVYLQHSAAVNPGNSGGPLLDEYGRVVGIVTLKARLENVSFAVPAETVRKLFKSQ